MFFNENCSVSREWYKEIKVINKEQQPSMWRAIWRAFGWHFVLTGALLLIEVRLNIKHLK